MEARMRHDDVTKRNFGHVRPAKIQIGVCIRASGDSKFLHVYNDDSDQTACAFAQSN